MRPVILSGGSGTRLWPVSRSKAPKQFVPLIGAENLFAATVRSTYDMGRSVNDPTSFAPPMIVGNAEHKFLIHDALDAAKQSEAIVLLEPIGRNTAAAAIAAALAEKDDDVLHLVRPSDHVIADAKAFRAAIAQAVPAAAAGSFVLFGIAPDYPETGYGYINPGAATTFDGVKSIAAFKEKPDAKGAVALIAGGALWNSGIFLYSPRTLIEEAKKLAPEMLKQVQEALDKAQSDARGITLDAKTYEAVASEPFDRVIMEHTKHGAVVPCSMGWNDVGSWQALWQSADKDKDGNATIGSVVTQDSKNCYVRSEGPAVAVLGLEDIAVIATKDAILVTPRNRTQDVKALVAAVQETKPDLAQNHSVARRPWGSYESIAAGSHFQCKHITVLPGRSLSLQMHHHRAEHWVVVVGTAKVEIDGVEKMVYPNESVYIPKGSTHRLTNPGMIELHLIEVQSGDYLGEDDIVRLADNYGRTENSPSKVNKH
ncbi:MAG: mannose-1-phosphate guanylyltransferase/mannose-6-phosphate isomerase [Alphaproteobacteria bacterium]|nr:mannose-1-phosphate guanylyltransferase/mannose-6-phosphate isomerase [Alphaproteobacteria bacterium]